MTTRVYGGGDGFLPSKSSCAVVFMFSSIDRFFLRIFGERISFYVRTCGNMKRFRRIVCDTVPHSCIYKYIYVPTCDGTSRALRINALTCSVKKCIVSGISFDIFSGSLFGMLSRVHNRNVNRPFNGELAEVYADFSFLTTNCEIIKCRIWKHHPGLGFVRISHYLHKVCTRNSRGTKGEEFSVQVEITMRLESSGDHSDLELPVRVRRGPLRSSACS